MNQRISRRFALFGAGLLLLILAACNGGGVGPHTLTVDVVGNGSGSVTSEPQGISANVGDEATAEFSDSTVVTLTAQADAGSSFDGWSGACTGVSTTCDVTMDDAKSVTATFSEDAVEPEEFTLTVATDGDGAGTVESNPGAIDCGDGGLCEATYDEGTVVTLTALPADGNFFAGWDGCTSATNTCEVTMDSDTTVTATFTTTEPDTVDVTVDFLGDGSGSVSSAPAGIDCTEADDTCSASFPTGEDVTLTASATGNSTFDGWSSNCTVANDGTCTITADADTTVEATFTADAAGDWQQNDPMAFVIEGQGHTSVNAIAYAYEEDPTLAPELVITHDGGQILEVPIAAGADDAEEFLEAIVVGDEGAGGTPVDANTVYATSSDLELTYDSSSGQSYDTNQLVGLRFAAVDLPADANIENAVIRFTAASNTAAGQELTIYGEASTNAAPYPCEFSDTCDTANPKISERVRTTASVNWTPGDGFDWEPNTQYETADVTTLVQEIIGQ